MKCLVCSSENAEIVTDTVRDDATSKEFYPDVEFRDIIIVCKDCGYTFSVVGSKNIATK